MDQHTREIDAGRMSPPSENAPAVELIGAEKSLSSCSCEEDPEDPEVRARNVQLALDQCEAAQVPCKKKLVLDELGLRASDLPVSYLEGTSLGRSLRKLSLVGNKLSFIPVQLVQSLPELTHLNVSRCQLSQLPDQWDLPSLRKLNLSHNQLTSFPEESIVGGLPDLIYLDMSFNKVKDIDVPCRPLLSKLELLNLSSNDLECIPSDLDTLKALKSLNLAGNFLTKIPFRICEMDLLVIDVSCNHLVLPPAETCEQGVIAMRLYWQRLRQEEDQIERTNQITGSLVYDKTPTTSALLGKSSSLVFPTGIEFNGEEDTETAKLKQRKVNLALDQCEAVRFPFKKKLVLNNLGLTAADLPLRDLVGTSLGNSLHKLSLVGNRLGTIPAKLVQNLPVLKHLDLSQCELSQLPDQWYLPRLTKLNLSHNRFTDFPEETMLEGLPELSDLDMYGNKVAEIIIPRNPKLLSKLEVLNLGYNDLVFVPPELDQLKSLKTLKVMNNFLANVPMRVCEMDLKTIDVSSNPVTEPPIETCERGICSMRRYWQRIRQEEQSKQKALDEVSKKVQRQKKKGAPKKNYDRLFKLGGPFKSSPKASPLGAKKVAETISETSPLSVSTPLRLATPRVKSGALTRSLRNINQNSAEVNVGRIVDNEYATFSPPSMTELSHISGLDRSSSDMSTGSLVYDKTPTTSALLGKSSSLVFPMGIEFNGEEDTETAKLKQRKVNLALDQCEAVRFPFKKKLVLNNLGLTAADLPLRDLVGTSLGNSLHKLSLVGNRLGTIPAKLVQNLPVLKHLDLSQCELSQLPDQWYLPRLTQLNLSHNRFTAFPEETMLEGLPELSDLDMYGNKVAEIVIPRNPKLLSKLEVLNLGYNDLVFVPPELDQLKSLKTLKVMNNFLANVPMRVCEMDLKTIDVSSNPVTEPPIETCERGICSMRRYWHIRQEEQLKQKAPL